MAGARTDLMSPIPDLEDQKILELRQMGLLPQINIENNPNTKEEVQDVQNQEETNMAEMTKEQMEKLAELKATVNEKASSIPKPVKYVAAAGAGVGLGYAAHKILHKSGDKVAEEAANILAKFF